VKELFTFLRPSNLVPQRYERIIFITNTLAFLFFWVTLGIFTIFYSFFGWITTLPLILMVAFSFLAIPFINRLNHRVGRAIFCLIPVWLTFFITIYFKLNSAEALTEVVYFDSRFILMATIILPGVVFRLEERLHLVICMGSTAILLLFYDPIHELLGAGFYQVGFKDPSYRYISYIVTVTFSVLLFGILLLRSVLERSEKDLLSQNKQLVEKQNEIEAQHEELLQHQEEMLASSEKLEQANELILKQQDALGKYNKALEALVEEKSFELVKTNEELVKHNNELLQFSYTVSHNLRGPVARMLGLTRLLNHAENVEDRNKLQEMILKSSEELDEILKDLSLIIDIRNDLYRVREKVILEDEWNKAVSLLGESVKSVFHLDVNFQNAPYVYGVRPMIQSIFYNLFSNAIKYQSPSRKLKVRVKSEILEDNRTVIEVSDNGLGIDMVNQQKNLFKLYKRFHQHVSGKGLGLYLVKTQVETLGGSIAVESQPDAGTTFKVTFVQPDEVNRQIFYDTDAVQLHYNGDLNVIVIRWKRNVSSHEYREAIEALINSVNSYRSPGWISDVRKQGVVSHTDQLWFAEKIIPQLVKSGLQKIAVVGINANQRSDYMNRLQHVASIVECDLEITSTMDEAFEWMERQLHGKTVGSTN
jgi:signal transduction histidine kinase